MGALRMVNRSSRFKAFARCVSVFLFAPAVAGCGSGEVAEPRAAMRVRAECFPPSSDAFYFPIGSVADDNGRTDDYQRAAYTRVLRAMNASSLSCGNVSREAYRCLWLPSYGAAAVILVERASSGWRFEAAEFSHPRNSRSLEITRSTQGAVSEARIRELLSALAVARFWTSPTWSTSGAEDGATWVIEGRVDMGYRVVSRANPAENSFKQAARSFFAAAQTDIPVEAAR